MRGESDTFVWPPNGMSVSLDGGTDWTSVVDIEPWAVFRIGGEITIPDRFTSSATAGLPMFGTRDARTIAENRLQRRIRGPSSRRPRGDTRGRGLGPLPLDRSHPVSGQ